MSLLNWTDNAPPVELTAPVGATDTTFYVSTSGGYPQAPFEFAIDLGSVPELVLCTAVVSNTQWTVTRGWDNSTAQAHTPKDGQIILITSEEFWAEANAHITVDPPDHTQYMKANGTGHDSPAQHVVGSGNYVAINTSGNDRIFGSTGAQQASYVLRNRFSQLYLDQAFDPSVPPPSHFEDYSFDGISTYPANGLHVHGRETPDEISEGHLWPPGTLALWAGIGEPPGWLPCDGRDVRTDLAPLCFAQWGYTCGSAIAWYPPPPILPTSIAYSQGNYTDPNSQAQLTIDVPYSYMQDPRYIAMQLPMGEPTYFKLPNLTAPKGLTWIIKMDYGYVWEPRPSPPPPLRMYCSPFRVDQVIPAVWFNDYAQQLPGQYQPGSTGPVIQEVVEVSEAPHPPGTWWTGFTWGFDAVSGIPIISGIDYIGPEQMISGPIAVPVFPFGQPMPSGFTLLQPPQPAYQVGPPIIVSEELVQLYSIRVNVNNGYGWALTDVPWTSLASGPWMNASYPPTDGNYLNGIAQVQQRNNLIAVTVSKAVVSNPGQPDVAATGNVAVNFFIYS